MGRPKLVIDSVAILDMRKQGMSIKVIAGNLGISPATLSRQIAELKYKEGLLTKYRELQNLQLTEHQFRILQAITPEKIDKASFLELVKAFYVLHKAQMLTAGKESSKTHGLLDYLLEIEKEENSYRMPEYCSR